MTASAKPRVLVLGLDGATWILLDPLLAQNKLPTLGKLIQNGSRCALRSCIQPSSEQAWSAFATGKQNGKFGLYGFYQRSQNSYALEYINASHRRAATLWRILSDRNKKCVVVNVPLTWPVEPINGALVSGLMTPGLNSEFTYPPGVKNDLLRELGEYIIDVDIERGETETGSLGHLVARVRRMSELQTRAFEYLLDKNPDWDFAMLVHRAPDILCHKFWRYQDPTHPLYDEREAAQWGSVINDCFEYLDAYNARLLEKYAGENTTVIVLSDHGFGPLTHAVYLNLYFAQRGLLAYKEQSGSTLASALRAGVKRLNNPLIAAAKSKVFEMLPQLKSNLHYSMAYGNMDWSCTKAYAVGTMGNVYLNVRGREPQGSIETGDYETVRDEVIATMRELQDPETRRPIFDFVYRREEIYHGDALDEAPDVIGLIDGPYHIAAVDWRGVSASHNVVEKVGNQLLFVSDTSGQHRMDGILIAKGAGISLHRSITPSPHLIDLAPTILQLLGEPIPTDMDGHAVNGLIADKRMVDYAPAVKFENAMDGAYSDAEQKEIEERLAGLGYLG
ncbi:MAG: alkaline phosphatase family protein [Chloroflexi bacterium]|nr:alkaline phosphatase family protein [Chloroflexota bacterium]